MNIFELLSFDIMEFVTSVQGIFIIVGIIFLIIGIVLLCMEKGKKNNVDNSAVTETVATPEVAPVVAPTPAVQETPVVTASVENQVPIQSAVSNVQEATPIVVSTEGGLQESVTAPVVEPINFTEEVKNEEPVVVPTPVVENKVETLENVAPVVPERIDVPETLDTVVPASVTEPVVEPLVQEVAPVTPVVEALDINPEPLVTVYGGANPESEINKEVLEEKPREIYGGANPLENTAPIPTVTVKEAYSGGLSATPVVETPVVEASVAPVVEKVEEPVVETLTPITPVVEPVVETAPVAPTPAPEIVQNSAVEAEPKVEEIEKLEF